jgi:cobalamin biosynthesis protein CobT
MARQATAAKKIIFFVSDGGGTCSGQDEGTYLDRMLVQIANANEGEVQIHTFGIGVYTEFHRKRLQALAEQNGGTYHEISRE